MGKLQITAVFPLSLMEKLKNYVEHAFTSKSDLGVSAIAQYLGSAENVPLNQRVAELKRRVTELEADSSRN